MMNGESINYYYVYQSPEDSSETPERKIVIQ